MAAELLLFADFELDRGAYELRREGRVVRLQRIPLDVLFLLVEQRGQLVTRGEIVERIWGKEVFLDTESSINTAIRKLRRALRDDRGAPCYIATVPGKGYRFIATINQPTLRADPTSDSQTAFPDHDRKIADSHDGPTGERRHLTVLFCDLINSTGRAAQRDSEEWWEMVAGYYRAAAQAIEEYGGHVVQYRGGGLMAYFGWPEAHDNDAECAIRASLAILEAISKLKHSPATQPPPSPRVGITSGAVMVAAGASKDADLFGEPPDIAMRVEAAADPGTVLVTAETHRLVSGLFVVEDRGAQLLEGIERPVQLFRVIRPSGVRGRFEAAAAAGGLIPFVGREDELRSLMNRWERTLEGEGQVALIIGEAGIGKSRLLQHFHEHLADTPHTWIKAGAGAFFQNTPFYPVTEMLRQALGDTPAQGQIAELESRLTRVGLKPAEAIPLLAPLLNLQLPPEYPVSTLTPEQQRRRLLATLVEWVLAAARTRPLVIATEDLHWADPSTLELIQLLVEQCATARLLLLYTGRPEFRAPWPQRTHHAQIILNRLSAGDARTMVDAVTAQRTLSEETISTVIERTGGVPLFVEELTRAVLEKGDTKLAAREIPATLHDSLIARLDRLGPAKDLAQVAAVIGREFSYELLHALHPIVEDEFQHALCSLADAELLYVRGIPPAATYQFKHALIRDAAYEALLISRRKEMHRAVARTIDEKFPALKEEHPEVLAHHWTEAGESDLAIAAWSKAGKAAEARSAFSEAQESYQRALAQLNLLPESTERDTRELTLQIELGSVMAATRGWSANETAETYERAKNLAERTNDDEALQVYLGLWSAAHTRGELRSALRLADEMLQLAHCIESPFAFVTAYWAQGHTRHYLGDLVGASQHLRLAIEHYREKDFQSTANDLGVTSQYFAGLNEWHLGHRDQAIRLVDGAVSLARRQNNPFALANVLTVGSSQVHILRGDFDEVLSVGREAVQLSVLSGFPLWNTICSINGAWARAKMGETGRFVEQMRRGLGDLNAFKLYSARTWFLCLLCEAQISVGAFCDALITVDEALEINPDELLYRPYALRLRGELIARSRSTGEPQFELAEQNFREAIKVAQRMAAKSDELCAAISLARLLLETERRHEARTTLAGIYSWFTEGFDTGDLKDAKALMSQMS